MRLAFLILLLATAAHAQSAIDTTAIKKELAWMFKRDQDCRKGGDSARYAAFIDSTNLLRLEAIIQQIGSWPDRRLVGDHSNRAAWSVLQHAPLAAQEKYLPMMQESVGRGESQPSELAYLEDRIMMRKGEKQLYGTQISINQKTGAPEVWPIADEKNVNKRRAALYLQPMEEYARLFGIDYKLPVE